MYPNFMNIICIRHILSNLSHNVGTIFHIYSYCVSDWYNQGSNVAGICMWGIKLDSHKEVSSTVDQFILTRLFLVVNIKLTTYVVFVYLPT